MYLFCRHMFSFLWGEYLWKEFMFILYIFSILGNCCTVFQRVPFYTPSGSGSELKLLCILSKIWKLWLLLMFPCLWCITPSNGWFQEFFFILAFSHLTMIGISVVFLFILISLGLTEILEDLHHSWHLSLWTKIINCSYKR